MEEMESVEHTIQRCFRWQRRRKRDLRIEARRRRTRQPVFIIIIFFFFWQIVRQVQSKAEKSSAVQCEVILCYVRKPMCSICFLRDLLGKDLGTSELTLRALDSIVLSPVKEKVYAFMLHTHFQLQKAKFRYAIQLSSCKKARKQSSKRIAPKSKQPSKEGAQIREISTELKLSNLSARQGFKQKRSNQKLNNPSAKLQIQQQTSIPAPNYKPLCLSMSLTLSEIAAQELLNPIAQIADSQRFCKNLYVSSFPRIGYEIAATEIIQSQLQNAHPHTHSLQSLF
jgi:hypothetical protein